MTSIQAQASSRIAIIIASKGRPEEIAQILACLAKQSLAPSVIALSVISPSDLPGALDPAIIQIFGPPGLCAQRNRGLAAVLGSCDIVAFYDDDFLPAVTSLAGMASLFASNPGIVGATGEVLRDGITQGGLTLDAAQAILAQYEASPAPPLRNHDLDWAYGCNMAFRATAIGQIRFDETLPLYGWQEDVDFAGQFAKTGRIVKTNAFAGVHLGVNKARTSGIAFGYSQMVNPLYLVRKGTMSPLKAGLLMARNFTANHVKSLKPESWIDRPGRASGNRRGLMDIMRGKIDPTEILRL